jgi:hypothetical protein
MSATSPTAPIVNVTIVPAPGTGITQLGMFMISVTTLNQTDQIINLQYIVSTSEQPQGDFVAFCFIGNIPAPGLPNSIFYASCNGIVANQNGQALTVQVVGAINSAGNPFFIEQTFDTNLWPGGVCNAGNR